MSAAVSLDQDPVNDGGTKSLRPQDQHPIRDSAMSTAILNWDRCEICEKEFKTKCSLKRHVLTVHTGYSVSCKICHVQFSRQDGLKKHLLKQHVDNNTSNMCGGCCQVRDEVLETTNPHIERLTIRTTDKGDHLESDFSFKCLICNKLFKFKLQAEIHVLSHCSEENQCKICDKKYINRPALGIRMKMHAGQSSIKCRECFKYYRQKHTGFASSRSSNDVDISAAVSVDQNSVNDCGTVPLRPQDQHPNMCGGCGQVIDEVLETANPHIERLAIRTTDKGDHLGSDFSFKCLICNKLFKFKRQAELHVTSHSTECNICNKKFKYRSNLIFHMRIHAGKRKKKCTECFKYYSGSFETHVSRFHKASGSHIIKCIVCNKLFPNEVTRTEHMTVHTGSRTYQCETCGKFYPSSTCLYAHRLGHAEKIPCNQCGKPIRKLNMPRHLECHSDVKAHQCEICGKGFKHLSNLMTHRLCHSDNRRHCCDLCDKRFKLPHQLRAHKKTHRPQPL